MSAKELVPTADYRADIRPLNGAPCLFVNGRPLFLNAPYLEKAPHRSFAAARTGIYLLHDLQFKVAENGKVNADGAANQMESLLRHESDAVAIVRFFPPAPAWWLDAHPTEVMQFDRDPARYRLAENLRDASWASDPWLQACSEWIADWCGQLHRRFGGRIIGYQFGMGSCGENNPVGACTSDGRWFCADFSPAMRRYFRAWLKAKYRTVRALRKAWSQPTVNFLTAEVPDRIERLRTDWFTFRSPLKAQTADYYQAFAERIEDCVMAFCSVIKRATDGASLAGSHLGAFLDNGFHGYIYHQACINAVHRALDQPAVDLFTSPASYENRDPGGDANSMMPAGSLALHGKLIFQDQDTRTCVLPPGYRENFTLGKIAADIPETVGVLKRDFAHMVIRGYGLWWHAMVEGMYDHPEVSACIARLSAIGKKSLSFPRGTAEGLALIADEESVFHQECANRLMYPLLYYQRQYYWSRCGAAWNVYLHDDLNHPAMPDHRLYYFLNTFYLTDAEIAAIEKKVKRNNAIVIWTYAPGIQSPDGFALKRVERLTGFRLKALDIQALPRVTFTNFDHPFVRYRPPEGGDQYVHGTLQPIYFGTGPMGNDERERVLGPIIYVADPEATVLGELDCIQEPGFCVKPMDGWTSVFSAAPMLNHYLLRNIARAAGLHIFSEANDVVLPGRSFLMLHARTAGEKTIRLPAPVDVFECYDGRELGRGVTEFHDPLPQHGTGLYFTGDLDAYRRLA
jgi:hypothetical protein